MRRQLLRKLNVPRLLAEQTVGKGHTERHHLTAGILVMVTGILITKASPLFDWMVWHVVTDFLGFIVHAIGLTPWIELFLKSAGEE